MPYRQLTRDEHFTADGPKRILALDAGLDTASLESLPKMDEPDNLAILRELGDIAALSQVKPGHFPSQFDLSD